jgi:LemA protein
MTPFLLVIIVLVVLVVSAAMFVVGLYNKLVALRHRFKNAYAQIDVQLKRRYDLMPNLVETAKGYLKHERGTLEAVIAARNAASSAKAGAAANPGEPAAIQQLVSAEGALSGALDRLALAVPPIKKNVIEACLHVVGSDGLIQEREAELLRAIADTLDCPIPPFVEIAAS